MYTVDLSQVNGNEIKGYTYLRLFNILEII